MSTKINFGFLDYWVSNCQKGELRPKDMNTLELDVIAFKKKSTMRRTPIIWPFSWTSITIWVIETRFLKLEPGWRKHNKFDNNFSLCLCLIQELKLDARRILVYWFHLILKYKGRGTSIARVNWRIMKILLKEFYLYVIFNWKYSRIEKFLMRYSIYSGSWLSAI